MQLVSFRISPFVVVAIGCGTPASRDPLESAAIAQRKMPAYDGVTRCGPSQPRQRTASTLFGFEPTAMPRVESAGDVAHEKINSVIQSAAGSLRSCYVAQLARDPGARGRVSASFTIDSYGSVRAVEIAGFDPTMDSCLCGYVARLRFGFIGATAHVTYPLIFRG